MPINLKPLLSLHFWFDVQPEPLLPINQKIFLTFFVILVLVSILLRVLANKNFLKNNYYFARIAKKIKNFLLAMGLVGLIFLFLNYERVALLGSRFWYGLWFISFMVWGALLLRKLLRLPQEKIALDKKKRFESYLPRS